MPTWVAASVKDKSTWARQGVSVFNTFIDPGWRGFLTLELVNHSSVGIFIPKGTPIAQIVFEELDATTNVPYDGKYQDQEWGAVSAR
jgi:dCTP deaminase